MELLFLYFLAQGTSGTLDLGVEALQELRVERAINLLNHARGEGSYSYDDYVRLYENLGIAYTYVDKKDEALKAFDMLLALDPGFAVSYTLSPKVTFVFEQARKAAAARAPPSIHLSWPEDLKVNDQISLDVRVVSDPKLYFERAELYARIKGAGVHKTLRFKLPPAGESKHLILPPLSPDTKEDKDLEVFMVAYDDMKNQVLKIGDSQNPRVINLSYEEPEPWYRKWWVWAIVGGVVAAGTGITVGIALQEPPDTVGGTFQ